MRNVMQVWEQPYYYAAGVTVDPRINVAFRGYKVGGKVTASLFSSIDGHDRDEEMMTDNVHVPRHRGARRGVGRLRDEGRVGDGRRPPEPPRRYGRWRVGQLGGAHADGDARLQALVQSERAARALPGALFDGDLESANMRCRKHR